jgi:hypothetical protein
MAFKIKNSCFSAFLPCGKQRKTAAHFNYNYRNTVQFEKELDFYLKYFKPVSLDELISKKDSGKKIFHLSFDDGLKECAEIIAPILLKKGNSCNVFCKYRIC